MRIIGGRFKGIRFHPPRKLPVRPTTDMAKEALFNILQHQVDLEGLSVLDLFSGTGNISLEFASRGASNICSVDLNYGCISYLKAISKDLGIAHHSIVKSDVFKYLQHETEKYDLIFSDPPYELSRIPEIAQLVFEKQLLTEDGLLIIEHQSMQDLSAHPNFLEKRTYSYSSFSFFKNSKTI